MQVFIIIRSNNDYFKYRWNIDEQNSKTGMEFEKQKYADKNNIVVTKLTRMLCLKCKDILFVEKGVPFKKTICLCN